MNWLHEAATYQMSDHSLTLSAGAKTYWSVDPNGDVSFSNAPALLFEAKQDFVLSATVAVDFSDTYDAGVLCCY
ncbi:MAG: DUF1349 domain-containing protein [Trueperaceae bacterium]